MSAKRVLGGLIGATTGAAIGWFGFNTIPAAIGTGCALAAGIFGAITALASKK